jgi:hypothetical protein
MRKKKCVLGSSIQLKVKESRLEQHKKEADNDDMSNQQMLNRTNLTFAII